MNYNKRELKEKNSIIHIGAEKTLQNVNLDFFFSYRIFPDIIMSFATQWIPEKRKMKIGDTIAQQVYIPPIKYFSQKIIFGVRINEIIDTPDRKGFSYETLEGHVERGLSSFLLENTPSGLVCRIQTFSEPANSLVRFLGPLFSIPYQAYCTRKALENVKELIRKQRL